jgi:AcrR family transcriptional regulator
MLDIVTRARVSKRDLYALFKNKHAVLAACIGERTQQMRLPLDPAVPMPQTRSALAALLRILPDLPPYSSCCPHLVSGIVNDKGRYHSDGSGDRHPPLLREIPSIHVERIGIT